MVEDLVARLGRLGFGEWEARAYLALLQRSPMNGYQVSKESGVPRSMVYEVLGKLAGRGAALVTHDDGSTLYAPVPPGELMQRLGREHAELTSGLGQELGQISQRSDEEYVWRIEGQENVLERVARLVERAQTSVFGQMHAEDVSRLRPALEAAASRGVEVALATIGEVSLPVGRVVQLPLAEPARAITALGMLLVADCWEVLIAEHRPSQPTRASWTCNHLLASLVEGHVRRTLLIPILYRALDVDGVLAVLDGDERALIEALLDRDKLAALTRGEAGTGKEEKHAAQAVEDAD